MYDSDDRTPLLILFYAQPTFNRVDHHHYHTDEYNNSSRTILYHRILQYILQADPFCSTLCDNNRVKKVLSTTNNNDNNGHYDDDENVKGCPELKKDNDDDEKNILY